MASTATTWTRKLTLIMMTIEVQTEQARSFNSKYAIGITRNKRARLDLMHHRRLHPFGFAWLRGASCP